MNQSSNFFSFRNNFSKSRVTHWVKALIECFRVNLKWQIQDVWILVQGWRHDGSRDVIISASPSCHFSTWFPQRVSQEDFYQWKDCDSYCIFFFCCLRDRRLSAGRENAAYLCCGSRGAFFEIYMLNWLSQRKCMCESFDIFSKAVFFVLSGEGEVTLREGVTESARETTAWLKSSGKRNGDLKTW